MSAGLISRSDGAAQVGLSAVGSVRQTEPLNVCGGFPASLFTAFGVRSGLTCLCCAGSATALWHQYRDVLHACDPANGRFPEQATGSPAVVSASFSQHGRHCHRYESFLLLLWCDMAGPAACWDVSKLDA